MKNEIKNKIEELKKEIEQRIQIGHFTNDLTAKLQAYEEAEKILDDLKNSKDRLFKEMSAEYNKLQEEKDCIIENQRKEFDKTFKELEFWKRVSAEKRKEFIDKIDKIKDKLYKGIKGIPTDISKNEMKNQFENMLYHEIDKIISENHMCPKDMVKSNAGDSPSDYQNGSVPEDTSNQICECGHKRPETIIVDDNILSVTAYFEYKEQLPKECWDCFCKKFKKKEVEDEN